MLTLSPGSVCDVCAEEYGSHCVPHSIPCGELNTFHLVGNFFLTRVMNLSVLQVTSSAQVAVIKS